MVAFLPDEEDGSVVPDEVPVALLGVELDGEAAGIPRRVGGTGLAADRGPARGDRGPLAHRGEHQSLQLGRFKIRSDKLSCRGDFINCFLTSPLVCICFTPMESTHFDSC